MTVALNGYSFGNHAPGRCSDRAVCSAGNSSTEPYIAAHNMLNAHSKAVEVFRNYISIMKTNKVHTETNPRDRHRHQIGIAINSDYAYPFDSENPQDLQAAQRDLEFQAGWFADPIYTGVLCVALV